MNNSDKQTTLIDSSSNGQLDVVNQFLDCKEIDVNLSNHDDETALMKASEEGHLDIVNSLLKYKEIDVNIQNYCRYTASMLASEEKHLDIVNRLKEWQQNRICEGFTLYSLTDYALYIPKDISELIIGFSIS